MARPLTPIFHWAIRLVIGGIFLYAGIVKIWNFKDGDWATQDFAHDVMNYHLTSWTASILTAIYLPWLEVIAGLCLAVRRFEAGAIAILSGLTAAFLVAISSAWARGLDITCGCFGKVKEGGVNKTNFPLHIAGDTALLIGLVILGLALCRMHQGNGVKEEG